MTASTEGPLRLAYVTAGKADDIHEWSGLNAAIRASLLRQGCTVVDVDQLGTSYPLTLRLRKRLHESLFGTTYSLERSPAAVLRSSRIVDQRVGQLGPVDGIVSPGTLPVAYLEGTVPLAIWADATFHALRATYPAYARQSSASIAEGDRVERAALERANLVCYASQWAADDAAGHYGIAREKLRVIPFGANCVSPFADEAQAVAAVRHREWSVTRFVFIGVDWMRKGGDVAVQVVRRLNDAGVKSVLSIIGCDPPAEVSAQPYVQCLGFLSKKNARDTELLTNALLQSHFLLVPTLADCFGLVFAEASAYALPSVARAVGGVASAVADGRTGFLLPADAGADAYCDALLPLIHDRDRYEAMAVAAYRDYATRLNWDSAGARFVSELRNVVRSADAGGPGTP